MQTPRRPRSSRKTSPSTTTSPPSDGSFRHLRPSVCAAIESGVGRDGTPAGVSFLEEPRVRVARLLLKTCGARRIGERAVGCRIIAAGTNQTPGMFKGRHSSSSATQPRESERRVGGFRVGLRCIPVPASSPLGVAPVLGQAPQLHDRSDASRQTEPRQVEMGGRITEGVSNQAQAAAQLVSRHGPGGCEPHGEPKVSTRLKQLTRPLELGSLADVAHGARRAVLQDRGIGRDNISGRADA